MTDSVVQVWFLSGTLVTYKQQQNPANEAGMRCYIALLSQIARLTVCFLISWNVVNSKPGGALIFSKTLQQPTQEYSVASSKCFSAVSHPNDFPRCVWPGVINCKQIELLSTPWSKPVLVIQMPQHESSTNVDFHSQCSSFGASMHLALHKTQPSTPWQSLLVLVFWGRRGRTFIPDGELEKYIFLLNANLFLFHVCFKNISDTLAQYPGIPTVILRWWKLKFCWLHWSFASFSQRKIWFQNILWSLYLTHALQALWVLGGSCTGASSWSDWEREIPLCSKGCGSNLLIFLIINLPSHMEMIYSICLLQR